LLAFAYLQAQKSHRDAAEELRKDADTLSAVLAAQGQIAAAHLDLEQSLEYIAEGARRLTGAGGAAIALRDGEKVVCRGRSGLMAPELGSCLNPQSGVCGQCLTSGEIQLCDDSEHDERVDIMVCRRLGMRSILVVPIRRQQDVLGILVVFSGWAGVFAERDVRALKLLAGLVIEALWSHEVHQREAIAPAEPVEQLQTPAAPDDSISAAMAEFRDAIASTVLPEPTPPIEETAEVTAPVEIPAAAEPELPAPAFVVLGNAEPRRLGRILTIVAAAIAVLAGAVEARLWRGAHVRHLLHYLRPAAVTPHIATPAPPAAAAGWVALP
jgi:signal transduction protein with GAF and PtsI domain